VNQCIKSRRWRSVGQRNSEGRDTAETMVAGLSLADVGVPPAGTLTVKVATAGEALLPLLVCKERGQRVEVAASERRSHVHRHVQEPLQGSSSASAK